MGSGLRYLLVEVLLRQRRHDDLGRLLDRYPDDETTIWTYSRALLNYRSTGIPTRRVNPCLTPSPSTRMFPITSPR